MEKKRKAGAQRPETGSVHPETQPQGAGLADGNSSKRGAAGGRQDTRTAHDKDGNEQQTRPQQSSR
jgi:hypothetical protein